MDQGGRAKGESARVCGTSLEGQKRGGAYWEEFVDRVDNRQWVVISFRGRDPLTGQIEMRFRQNQSSGR